MAKSLSSYLLYALITVLVVVLYLGDFGGLKKLQWKLDDLMYSIRGEGTVASDIVLINIDQASLDKYGDWPWSHDMLADLIAACNAGEPKAVLIDLDLTSRISEDTTEHTRILANQISWVENVVLPYDIALAEYSHNRMTKPEFLWNNSIQADYGEDIMADRDWLHVRKPFLPSGILCQYADGLGFSYVQYDDDREVRWAPLVAKYDGYYYPAAQLLTAALYTGYGPTDIVLKGDNTIQVGGRQIPVDETGRVYINYNTQGEAFRHYSVADLFKEETNLSMLRGALVIIGITAPQAGDVYSTPVMSRMPRSILSANIIENITHENYVKLLDLPIMVNVLMLLAFGALCAVLLPRVPLLYRFISLAVFAFILANISYVLFSNYGTLMRPLYLVLQILLFMMTAPLLDQERFYKGFGYTGPPSKKKDASAISETPVPEVPLREIKEDYSSAEFQKTELMGTPPSGHSGQLSSHRPDAALPSQQVPAPESPGNRETGVPAATPDASQAPDITSPTQATPTTPPPLQSPMAESMSPAPEVPVVAIPTTNGGGMSIKSASASPGMGSSGEVDSVDHLGRYQVMQVLGKGAMGTVFKGIDPAIGRSVALKTIRLDFVSDETELADLRDRLLREAQAAGQLSHPNIVTIYDAGSEGTLQYIAMEYLEGQTLEKLIKRHVQFSYKIIANIIIQICGALEYAHSQGIVHRDIKPANIMVLSDYAVKVMDFGIARIDTSSMTRTGVAMGTPNYIAPELLQGKEVDRRCDIYSLGVVIYELLTGRRPFKGENLTSLVYSIVNEDPPPPSTINDNMPLIFDHITAKALAKNPTDRYQKASEIKLALADFVGSFSGSKKVGI